MGTRIARNLFLGKFELDALLRAPYQPYLRLWFIVDIFMIWTEGLQKLELFVDYLNNLNSTV